MRLTSPARRAALLVLAAGCALSAGASWSAPVTTVGGGQLGTGGTVRGAGTTALPATLTAAAFVVADAASGEVLAARAPHRQLPPASTLKTLTALTVIQQVPADRQVAAFPADLAVECSCVGVEPGRVYTVDALLHAVLLRSGNDAANVLATAAGDRTTTLAAMNTLARRLRADDTYAATPSGLDADGQHSSAYDLALIVRAGLDDDRFRAYFNAPSYSFGPVNGARRQLTSQNALRRHVYPGQIGGKDGWTTPARHTFVGAARRSGRTLIVSVLGADRTYATQASALLDWAFAQPEQASGVGTLVRPLRHAPDPAPAPHAPAEEFTADDEQTDNRGQATVEQRSDGERQAGAEQPMDAEHQADAEQRVGAELHTGMEQQADVDPLAEPEPRPRPAPGPVAEETQRRQHLPFRAQASLSLGAVLCTGIALFPGRRPRPTRPGGVPRPPKRGSRRTAARGG